MEKIKVNMSPNPLDVQTIHASQNDAEARQWEFELHNNGELIDTSDVSEQMFFKAYKGGTEQILPENTSTPTTSPFNGDIKYPQGLLSDQEFLYRESPTEEDGLAKITDIKGNTLVWNQLVQNGNFASTSGWTRMRSTFSVSNNIATVKSANVENQFGIYPSLSIKANHKYFISFDLKTYGTITMKRNLFAGGQRQIYAGKNQFIDTPSSDRTLSNSYTICFGEPVSDISANYFELSNYMIVDLTQLGLDSITSVEEFTSLFSKPYYDYCQGAMLSFGGRNVKFNQLAQNGNFESITGWGGNNSSITVANNVLTGTTTTSHATVGLRKMDNVSFVANHKYLISAVMSCSVASDYCVARFYVTGYDFRTDALAISANTKKRQVWTLTPTSSFSGSLYIYPKYSYPEPLAVGDTFTFENVMLIDLTEMFGAGNEPSAEGFKELFPNDYYEYNVSQYMNLGQPVSLKTTGKNLVYKVISNSNIDGNGVILEDTTHTYSLCVAKVVAGKQYHIGNNRTDSAIVGWFTEEPQIGSTSYDGQRIVGSTLIPIAPITGYIVFRIDNQFAEPTFNLGTGNIDYEPYTSSTLYLPISTYFSNGMKSAGSVYDELTPTKAITRIGAVDLGSLTWSYASDAGHLRFVSSTISPEAKLPANNAIANAVCTKYKIVTEGNVYNNQKIGLCIISNSRAMVCDTNYTDATSFKTAMDGVILYYELATPIETSFTTASLVTENGEVALANENGVLVGKCNSDISADAGFIEGKIKLSDEDGDVYSSKIQLHVERSPQ